MGKICAACGQAIPTVEGLVIDDDRGEVRLNGKSIHLTVKHQRLLSALARKPGRCVSKGAISDAIYFDHHGSEAPDDKIIDVFVCKMRPQLKSIGLEIKTHWGKGFELVVPGLASKESDMPISSGDVAAMNYGGM